MAKYTVVKDNTVIASYSWWVSLALAAMLLFTAISAVLGVNMGTCETGTPSFLYAVFSVIMIISLLMFSWFPTLS